MVPCWPEDARSGDAVDCEYGEMLVGVVDAVAVFRAEDCEPFKPGLANWTCERHTIDGRAVVSVFDPVQVR